ncbi:hypothetical protein A6M14_03600 [Acinetobacter sp. Ac_877]|uniref:hypothetical protein n=1 Tax=Acinetobacter portensis TaxID=1839785 RepID=UPI00128E29C2|nr:hypothetical protein [Acinetobacter portensis]MPW40395.1 hypothetical protein [Acinetobacter portensis]
MTQEKKYSVGTTSKNENNVQHIKISRKKKLFLLFYTTKNRRGDNFMYFAAKTRRYNIENASWFNKDEHLVFNVPIQDIAEVVKTVLSSIEKRGGVGKVVVKEISIFSHAWFDGPTGSAICTMAPESEKQMKIDGGWSKLEAHWATDARFVMFGCNTASDDPQATRSFAEDISKSPNFRDVEIWGQTGPAKPSFYPDKRDSSALRNVGTGWSVNATYMVAGTDVDGFAATRGVPLNSPTPLPMKKYVNGVQKGKIFQSQFNDHRKN